MRVGKRLRYRILQQIRALSGFVFSFEDVPAEAPHGLLTIILGRCEGTARAFGCQAGRKKAFKDGANLALFCEFSGLDSLCGYSENPPHLGRRDISGGALHRESGSEKASGIEDYLGLFFHFDQSLPVDVLPCPAPLPL
jgi:hypothetical protein